MPRRILLVESPDDVHVVKHICGNREIPKLDEIKPHKSVEAVVESLPVRLKASEQGDIIGVILDADTSLSSRWHSIRDRLIDLGYPDVPDNPVTGGTIVDAPPDSILPRMGVWLMPDNQHPGKLEDFLRFLIPAPSALFDHVTASVSTIPEGCRLFKESDEIKAVIHTWLAWQERPGKPFGTAITAQYLDPTVPQVDVLASWLRRLFYSQA